MLHGPLLAQTGFFEESLEIALERTLEGSPRNSEPGASFTMVTCPLCRSTSIARDSSGVWLFLFAWLIPPFTWLLFLLNVNARCRQCGIRFRKDSRGS